MFHTFRNILTHESNKCQVYNANDALTKLLSEHRPPPNASIILLLNNFCRASSCSVCVDNVAVLPGSGSWSGTDSRIRVLVNSDADRHQDVISWSLGHTPALHKISSKSVGNFFDNPVNADFGLRTPGSGRWSGSSPNLNSLVPQPCPTSPSKKFRQNPFTTFSVIRRTDKQTNRPKWKHNLIRRR